MAYLTIAEYEEFTGKSIEDVKFNELLPKASDVLDQMTNYFYYGKDINADPYIFRSAQFKKALCAQIQHFKSIGMTTQDELNNRPQSVSLGRTSITMKSNNEQKESIFSADARDYLVRTGLLYKGLM